MSASTVVVVAALLAGAVVGALTALWWAERSRRTYAESLNPSARGRARRIELPSHSAETHAPAPPNATREGDEAAREVQGAAIALRSMLLREKGALGWDDAALHTEAARLLARAQGYE